MKRMFLSLLFITIFFTSCSSNHLFDNSYEEYLNNTDIPEESLLAELEEPEVLFSKNLLEDLRKKRSEYWLVVGYGTFNVIDYSENEIKNSVINLCKKKNAKFAVYSKQFSGTDFRTSIDRQYYTSYDSSGKPHTEVIKNYIPYSIDKYDYEVYLCNPIPADYYYMYRPGLFVYDMTIEEQTAYRHNTGALVGIVYQNSPAYFANIVIGDIITAINGQKILNSNDFYEVMKTFEPNTPLEITIFRDSKEQIISLISN